MYTRNGLLPLNTVDINRGNYLLNRCHETPETVYVRFSAVLFVASIVCLSFHCNTSMRCAFALDCAQASRAP